MMEFRAGGIVRYSPGAIVEFTYAFDGQKLTLKYNDPEKGPQPDDVVEVSGLTRDKMTTQRTGPQTPPAAEAWTRLGSPEDQSRLLLGSWTAPRDMGGRKVTNNWQFRPNGSAVFTVAFQNQTGQYQLTKENIRLNVDRAISVDGPISWEGEILVLPGNRSPTKMHRF